MTTFRTRGHERSRILVSHHSLLALLPLLLPVVANAQSPSTVYLQKDCTGLSNCFTTTAALTSWLWGTRNPGAGDRVTVQAGTGVFDPFVCPNGEGYVTVVGSGRDATIFERLVDDPALFPPGTAGAIDVTRCEALEFGNLEARGEAGVTWQGAGSATWWNVDLIGIVTPAMTQGIGAIFGWYDVIAGDSELAEHFMFGARVEGRGASTGNAPFNVAFQSSGGDIWFYGGDVIADHALTAPAYAMLNVALSLSSVDPTTQPTPIFRAFGSSIRSEVGVATGTSFQQIDSRPPLTAVALLAGDFHMHGGIIRVDASGASTSFNTGGLVAVGVYSNAHTPGTAFAILPNPAGGTATRAASVNGAHLHSPFLWPAHPDAPAAVEDNGQGIFVDTAAGPANSESHLMVRDTSCSGSGGPWRDMATGACRS